METKPRTLFNNALIYGLLTAVVSIAFSVLTYVLDVPFKSPVMYFSFIILIAGVVYGTLQYRNIYSGGYLSFGKAFLSGFFIVLTAIIITTIYTYVFMTIIDPSFLDKVVEQSLEQAETKMMEKGLSEDQMGPALEITKKMMSPAWLTIMGLISNLIFGSIIALIAAIFTKKEDKTFQSQFKDVQ